ncbi:hypothetical protein Tco_1237766 [Tanacetum coccineum]
MSGAPELRSAGPLSFLDLKNVLCDALINQMYSGLVFATSSETSKVENAPAEMLRDLDQQMEKRTDDAMAMTIQYGVRGMILEAQSEAFKQENVPLVGSEEEVLETSIGCSRLSLLKWLEQSERMIQTWEVIIEGCVVDFVVVIISSIWCVIRLKLIWIGNVGRLLYGQSLGESKFDGA